MTPNDELMARFLALSKRMDAARAKFMARKAATELRYLEATGKPFAHRPKPEEKSE